VVTEKEYLALKATWPNLVGNETNPPPFGSPSLIREDKKFKLSAGQLIELAGLK